MGLVNYIFSIEASRVDALLRAVERSLSDASVEPIAQQIESLGLTEWAAEELADIEFVAKKSLFRRTESRVLRPEAGFVIVALLQQLGYERPTEKVCDPDKAFQMLQTGHFGVKLSDIEGTDDWFAVMHCKLDSPPRHLRTGGAPDYVLVPQGRRERLAQITSEILARSAGKGGYLTDPLRKYEALLRGPENETIVAILT